MSMFELRMRGKGEYRKNTWIFYFFNYTLYNVQYTVRTMYNVHTVYKVQYLSKMYIVYCIMYILENILYKCITTYQNLKVILGGPTPFLPMQKCVFPYTFFPIFPHGEKWEKKYMERKGKVFISLSFHILFSPFFPMGNNGKTHIFPWAKMGLDPPPPHFLHFSWET